MESKGKSTYLAVGLMTFISTLSMQNALAADYQFIAADSSNQTKLCLSAVTNNLLATKKYINRVSITGRGQSTKANMAINSVSCNNLNLIEFTAKYNAEDTFNYLNRTATMKYKMSNEDIRISDLAHNSLSKSDQTIIVRITRR